MSICNVTSEAKGFPYGSVGKASTCNTGDTGDAVSTGDAGQSLGQEDPPEKEMATCSVFLPGKSHGQRSLAGYSPKGHKELATELMLLNCGVGEDS